MRGSGGVELGVSKLKDGDLAIPPPVETHMIVLEDVPWLVKIEYQTMIKATWWKKKLKLYLD